MRAKRRQRRERLTFFVSLGVIALAIATTVYVAHNRTSPFDFNLQSSTAPAVKTYDHFDFSTYWLATHGQPNLPIHGLAAYLRDVSGSRCQSTWRASRSTR